MGVGVWCVVATMPSSATAFAGSLLATALFAGSATGVAAATSSNTSNLTVPSWDYVPQSHTEYCYPPDSGPTRLVNVGLPDGTPTSPSGKWPSTYGSVYGGAAS